MRGYPFIRRDFVEENKLRTSLHDYSRVILGISAGAMNMGWCKSKLMKPFMVPMQVKQMAGDQMITCHFEYSITSISQMEMLAYSSVAMSLS